MRSLSREAMAARLSSSPDDTTTERTLRRILELARRAVPAGEEAGIVLVSGGEPAMAGGTAHLARQLDRTQCESGRGPGLEAVRQLQVFNLASIASSSSSWPDFSRLAARLGVASSLSVPLTWAGRALGAVGLYSSRAGAFAGCEAAALEVAREAALALASLPEPETLHRRRRRDGFEVPGVLPAGRSPFGAAWPVADAAL